MSFDLLSLGLGGALGAALGVLASGARLSATWGLLDSTYKTYRTNRTDEDWAALEEAFSAHDASIRGFSTAISKLKRALRIR